jgi:hypothetical protein
MFIITQLSGSSSAYNIRLGISIDQFLKQRSGKGRGRGYKNREEDSSQAVVVMLFAR